MRMWWAWVLFLLLGGALGQQHPTRVIMRWKPSHLKSIGAADGSVDVVSFNNTGGAEDFLRANRDRLEVFMYDVKMRLGLSRKDTLMNMQWYLDTLKVKDAWKRTSGRRDVLVAIIDSGYDFSNTDVRNNIYTSVFDRRDGRDNDLNGVVDDVNGYNFGYICCDGVQGCINDCMCKAAGFTDGRPVDYDGHGTGVAGIVGAGKNNGGIIGISPYVRVLPIKITDCYGDIWSSSVISAFEYAIKMKADILSCSFGDIYPYGFKPEDKAPAFHKTLVELYRGVMGKARDANALVVASAGNDNIDLDRLFDMGYSYSPCLIGRYLDNIICVGSTDKGGEVSVFSNFGKASVHTMAPGEGIVTTGIGNKYVTVFGTSFASPMVTGVVALGLSYLKQVRRLVPARILRDMIVNSTGKVLDAGRFMGLVERA